MELQTNLNCSELFLMTPKTKSYCTEYGHDNLSSGNNSIFCFDIFFPLNHLRTFSVQIKTTFTVGLIKLPLCTSCSCTVCILQPVGSCFCCVSFCRSSFVITGYMEDFALVLETSCVTMCHGALCGLIENRDKKCSKEKCNFLKTKKIKSSTLTVLL